VSIPDVSALAAVLVGREPERRVLDRLIGGARAGRSGVVGVVGDVGIGKSALLDYASQAAGGMRVLRARGIQSEARIPFAGLLELLRPALGHIDRIAAPQREALEGALALRPSRAQDRFAIGAATLSLLIAYSDAAPLLVLVDDAHWVDGSTADALLFAFRRLFADPVAVVLSVREGAPSLIDGTDVPVHRLGGLDLVATAELLGRHSGTTTALPDDLIDRLHRGTGGNPLALIELAGDRATIAAGAPLDPPLPVVSSIARVYIERCTALSESAREMLLLAAAGDTVELPTLARAAAAAQLDLGDLAASEAIGLVAVEGNRVEFRHPLMRGAVYAAAPPDRRRAMHRAWARALPDADADRRAWHLALATLGPDDAASSAMEQAALRARSRSAYDVASQAFERGAGLAPQDDRRCALLIAAADAAWLGGLASRAVALLDQARGHSPPADLVVPIEQLRGHIATRMGPVSEGRRILLDGAAAAAGADADRAIIMLAEAVNAAFYAGDASAMRHAAEAIVPLLGPGSSRHARFFAATARGMALIFCGEKEREGAAMVREAVGLIEDLPELSDPRLLAWAAMGPLWLRESGAGRSLADRALAVARRQSAVGALPFLLSHVAIDGLASDRWIEAEAGFHEAIALARETGQRTDLAFALARLAWLEARQGAEAACRSHAAQARALAAKLDLGLSEIWSLAALGDLELGCGRPAAALVHFETELAALLARGVGDVDLSPRPELIELNLRLGRPEQAAAHLETFERGAADKGQPWALARAARCRGLLGPDDELDRHFGDALAWHAETPDTFETARTQLAYGGRLRRGRQRIRAREHLRAALGLFDHLGAVPWSDMAGTELAATGERARRRDPATRNQLTPQELQIAVLLSAGRTTREAAAALFLSPKTIEYHLRSIYRKLDISSRDELAATLAGPVSAATLSRRGPGRNVG
jgi:DNA-binding CsgD family transcriptional regulator